MGNRSIVGSIPKQDKHRRKTHKHPCLEWGFEQTARPLIDLLILLIFSKIMCNVCNYQNSNPACRSNFFVIICSLRHTETTGPRLFCRMTGWWWIMKWKEAVDTYFNVLFRYLRDGWGNRDKPQVSHPRSEAGTSQIQVWDFTACASLLYSIINNSTLFYYFIVQYLTAYLRSWSWAVWHAGHTLLTCVT
jgi:hypothetical protein